MASASVIQFSKREHVYSVSTTETHRKPKQWEFILRVLSHVQLKTKPLLLGILITLGATMFPAPADLLIAVKQKAYIALLKAILNLIIPFLLLMSNFRFSSNCLVLM